MKVYIHSRHDEVANRFIQALQDRYLCSSFKNFSSLLDAYRLDKNAIVVLESDEATKFYLGELNKVDAAKVIVTNSHPTFFEGMTLLKEGIKGYANSYIAQAHIPTILHHVEHGNIWLYPEFMQQMIQATIPETRANTSSVLNKLSSREKQTAMEVANGLSNKQIALELDVTERTVKSHLSSIFTKLGVKDRVSLALLINKS